MCEVKVSLPLNQCLLVHLYFSTPKDYIFIALLCLCLYIFLNDLWSLCIIDRRQTFNINFGHKYCKKIIKGFKIQVHTDCFFRFGKMVIIKFGYLSSIKSWKLVIIHSTYSWNIKRQKCARMGLNSFHIKWMIGPHCNWKNQNPGSRFGATS